MQITSMQERDGKLEINPYANAPDQRGIVGQSPAQWGGGSSPMGRWIEPNCGTYMSRPFPYPLSCPWLW